MHSGHGQGYQMPTKMVSVQILIPPRVLNLQGGGVNGLTCPLDVPLYAVE